MDSDLHLVLVCVVVYRRFIAHCRLRIVRFTTSCKNISSEYPRVEKFKQGAGVAQPTPTLPAARQQSVGYSYSRRLGCCHIVTLGSSAKGSSDFLQGSLGKGSREQKRVQVTL